MTTFGFRQRRLPIWQNTSTLQSRTTDAFKDVQETLQANKLGAGSSAIRLQLYKGTQEIIEEKPLLGWGIGGAKEAFSSRYQNTPAGPNTAPNNDYLLHAAEGGLLGFLALLILLFLQLRIACGLKVR